MVEPFKIYKFARFFKYLKVNYLQEIYIMEDLLELKSVKCNFCHMLFKTKNTDQCEYCGSDNLSVVSDKEAMQFMKDALTKST